MLSSRTEVLLPFHTKHRRSAPALRNVVACALICALFVGTRSFLFAAPSNVTHVASSGQSVHEFDLDAHGFHGSWSQQVESILMVILLRGAFILAFALAVCFWCSNEKSWASTCSSVQERLSIVRALCAGKSDWRKASMPMPCAFRFAA